LVGEEHLVERGLARAALELWGAGLRVDGHQPALLLKRPDALASRSGGDRAADEWQVALHQGVPSALVAVTSTLDEGGHSVHLLHQAPSTSASEAQVD